jgi:divalent metal cation (Fe/Co/Zn/Cd) transporter
LVLALVAVVATMLTGNPVYDSLGTVAIGILLIVIAMFVAIEVKALLIGQGVEPMVDAEMREWLNTQPEVALLLNLLTM